MEKADLYALDLSHVRWEKSSFSTNNANCVEVAQLPGGAVAVRDSKNPHREALCFTAAEWSAFRSGVEGGELQG
ncbi:DUF397 domain-containing protein [Streptomyces natalensis]|uniref:DUF397 domain-containing protein n=1 Tax=Streptomyces natalensis ATCC 27448 TaxID=1240678 RepID=A0A0D7CG72_9ACTN|nr:DUF397 domain-containing protein [Streptomyces natalensis]KIZ15036.1 hypothetical protein SNA_29320 [Streptomyces natalensis ATCC 27448]